jgi:hypothetical protein
METFNLPEQPPEPEPVLDVPAIDMTGTQEREPTKDAVTLEEATEPPPRRRAGRPKGSRNKPKPYHTGNGRRRKRRQDDTLAAAAAMVEAVEALADAAKAQQREITDLRRKLDGLRDVLE